MLDKSKKSGELRQENVSAEEIARFDALAESWWDPEGKYKTALAFNAARTGYILHQLARCHGRNPEDKDCLRGLSLLDVGCGGGLISEALAAKGARVTGIDASATSIEVARRHAAQSGLDIDYRHCLTTDLLKQDWRFDVVINAEVVEHVPDQASLISQCASLLKPDGTLVLATLNRTLLSWFIAILGAEYVMRYLPVGTHDWKMFVKPSEMAQWLAPMAFELVSETGMKLNPLTGKWRLSHSLAVNYIQVYRRKFVS
ncbi:bifunctional 2-polyprenyl-6-hydroxyphenol methylase/3-demethylubiquinol 3-O-methyltransferase UbiG [Alteromonas lipolytica]|uniref:Ubiquinone biosynthesis O-methyltransferase n=1 Tax=Alteromonas lipolytica TaxID=1856405 RepID=A0A1E8F9C4_9ALTE|nr:bifunctional 2-polyprenyl-6-hydroxyphenol methylase/3-demethylubiquinol 3-O-methyltransferase UbiG [Alteromonas lipolytica]OFI32386.1 bifunctional 3-demethylubiquinol 3-O-methyltransferase/2-polyprenyl-6-hydroxyphenol methylase [Alteromonas lipolytica]GGF86582.1 ubiquinone biosynthesis O-methyltransferase [Alteromonas lipolytica]